MFFILFFTVAGFLAGLGYLLFTRKVRPANVLTAAFLALLSAGVFKVLREHLRKNLKGRGEWPF